VARLSETCGLSGKNKQVALALAAFVVSGIVLLRSRRAILETTLVSAWWWSWGALLAVTLVELLAARISLGSPPFWLSGLRLIAGGLTLCPALSLMGAKRPQDRAWNWVVLALWGLLILPVAVSWYRPTATPLAAYGPLAYFLWVLIALGFVNLIATRFWLVALLLATGQVAYLASHLPFAPAPSAWGPAIGNVCLAGSLPLAALLSRRESPAAIPLDRAWLDFRDTFGLFWSLRLQERVNDAAMKLDWPVRLTWFGFVAASDGRPMTNWPSDLQRAVRQTLQGLLRRFVSPRWLSARWGDE
jgi:hypothetical protein